MIASLARHTLAAGVMFCASSFAVLAGGLGYLWTRGHLNEEKAHEILAIVYGVDLDALEAQHTPQNTPLESEQPSLDDMLERRLEKSLDLDLRAMAFDKTLVELRTLEDDLRSQRERFDARLREFETRLNELETETLAEGLTNVQLKLEAIQPKQAKDLLLKMVAEPAGENDDAIDAAVTIFKNMPVEKSRKIIAEFKTQEEIQQLHEILARIRLGQPAAEVLSQARKDLENF